MEKGKYMPQEWLDKHGKNRGGTVMNCATCVEMMAGLPTNLGFILSIWSEHGEGVHPRDFLIFLNKYFTMNNLMKWSGLTVMQEEWVKVTNAPPLDPSEVINQLIQIKQILPNNSGVLVYIKLAYGSHYIVLAKSNDIEEGGTGGGGGGGEDQSQLMYIDPQRKTSYKGIDSIIKEFERMGVKGLIFFIASPTYDTSKTDAKLAEKGMGRHRISENESFVINKKGFGHDAFKPKIKKLEETFGKKRAHSNAWLEHKAELVRRKIKQRKGLFSLIQDVHNARLRKMDEAASSGGGGGGGGGGGVDYYSDPIPTWEEDREPFGGRGFARRKGRAGWMTPKQWKYSKMQVSDLDPINVPSLESWDKKQRIFSELKKKARPKPKVGILGATAKKSNKDPVVFKVLQQEHEAARKKEEWDRVVAFLNAAPFDGAQYKSSTSIPSVSMRRQRHPTPNNNNNNNNTDNEAPAVLPQSVYACEIGECNPLKKFSQPNQACSECYKSLMANSEFVNQGNN